MLDDTAVHLGVDLGGVLMEHTVHESEAHFIRGVGGAPAVGGALEGLSRVVTAGFVDHVWVVSKCRVEHERPLRDWLERNGFFDVIGLSPDHVVFCRERAEKAIHARQLRLTHFVDDRLEVLSHLHGVTHRFLFRPDPGEVDCFAQALSRVHVVASWEQLAELVITTRTSSPTVA